MTNAKALIHYDSETDCIDLRIKDTKELIVSLSAVQLHLAVDKLRGSHVAPDETVGIIAMLPDAKRTPPTNTTDTVPIEEIPNQPIREAHDPTPAFNSDRAKIAADLYARTYTSTIAAKGSAREAEAAATRAVRYVFGEV